MKNTSALQQIALNAIPVIGYWFWNWSMFSIVYLYWMEALITCIFVFLKIAIARGPEPSTEKQVAPWTRILLGMRILFIRVGILMFYWIFILAFVALGQGKTETGEAMDSMRIIAFAHQGFNLAVLAFFLSQVIEFLRSFIYSDAYKTTPPSSYRQLFDARTIVIHIVIVLGTFSSQFLQQYASINNRLPGFGFVLILFMMKSIADFALHVSDKSRPDIFQPF